jgi:hypothetical protein
VAAGFGLMQRYGTSVSLLGDVLPALLVFSLGLAMTVSPLTATVLADASESDAGIASAVNNAIARTAGLVSVAAVGAIVSAHYGALLEARLGHRLPASARPAVVAAKRRTFGTIDARAVPVSDRRFARQAAAGASEDAFHLAVGIGAGLLVVAGVGGLALRTQRRSPVEAGDCAGGTLAGVPLVLGDDVREHPTAKAEAVASIGAPPGDRRV